MKKLLCVLLAMTMAVGLCACGGKDTAAGENAETAPAAEDAAAADTDAADTQEPAADAAEGRTDGHFAPIAKEEIKVGVIHLSDPAEGSGYTYTHDQGIVGMQKSLGLADEQIVRKNKVSDTDPTAVENAIRECIEEGCNIIFATSWGYMDTCEALSQEFPEVIFSHGTGYKSNGSNFNNYFGRIYQARYLAGIAAGLKTESNKIGYVAAMGQDNSEVTGGCNAFAMGAYSVNPDCQVFVKVTNSWFDPEGEAQAAEALIADGCDVIGQHCDTPNPQTAAEKAGVFGVGYNSDMSNDAPGAVLTSVMWDWSVYYTKAVEDAINGTWTGENYFGSMADGLVNIAPLSELCAEGTKEAVEEAQAKLVSGEWDVFQGDVEDNEGVVHSDIDDATITGNMNWYFKNVVAK